MTLNLSPKTVELLIKHFGDVDKAQNFVVGTVGYIADKGEDFALKTFSEQQRFAACQLAVLEDYEGVTTNGQKYLARSLFACQ